MNPVWVTIFQWVVIIANLGALWVSRSTRKRYLELSTHSEERVNDYREIVELYTERIEDYEFHIKLLAEEIKLLKTSEGLYDVRNDPEKYQTFLTLLRNQK